MRHLTQNEFDSQENLGKDKSRLRIPRSKDAGSGRTSAFGQLIANSEMIQVSQGRIIPAPI